MSKVIDRGQLEVLDDRVNANCANYKRYEEVFSNVKGNHFQPELKDTCSN